MGRIVKKLLKSKNSSGASTVSEEDFEANRFLSDFVLMDRFGWTPRQIEELTEFEYEATLAVIDTLKSIEKAEREKQSAKQSTNRSAR